MSVSTEASQPKPSAVPLIAFFGWLTGLAALRLGLGYVQIPIEQTRFWALVVTVVFVVVPVFAVFKAASYPWTMRLGFLFIVVGLLVHGLTWWGGHILIPKHGPYSIGGAVLAGVLGATMETALFTWCVGLGALIARLFRERNLLLPVCIFLALFDVFLVLTPFGFTRQIMAQAPEALGAVGHSIPRLQSRPTHGMIVAGGYIGPADFIFMAMFFVALFKFEMRTSTTLKVLIPTLLMYMVLARYFQAVPLLVPIGLCVLLVNAREFKLSREETLSTALVSFLGLALIAWSAFRQVAGPNVQVQPAGPSMRAPSRV